MRFPRLLSILISLAAFASAHLRADSELVYTLMVPSATLAPGSQTTFNLVAFNPTSYEADFQTPERLSGKLMIDSKIWEIELLPQGYAPASIQPNNYASRRYTLSLPTDATGMAILEFDERAQIDKTLRSAIRIVKTDTPTDDQSPTRPITDIVSPTPAAAALKRAIAGHLNPHEPIYFIYGPDAPAAKFQFSFKYRLLTLDRSRRQDPTSATLQFGYTQRSLWDIQADSSPFYDTSYMQEVFFERLSGQSDTPSWFTPLGLQVGVKHESNGREGLFSRSLNVYVARYAFSLGSLDSWNLLVLPELQYYAEGLGDIDGNPLIRDYRGYGKLRLVFGKNDGLSLMFTGYSGPGFRNPTTQFDLALPIRTDFLDLGVFFHVQYFDGYGESLLNYDQKSQTIRAGLSFVR